MITLRGIEPDFKVVGSKSLEKMPVTSSQFFMVKVNKAESSELIEMDKEDEPEEVKNLLEQYKGIFGEPH